MELTCTIIGGDICLIFLFELWKNPINSSINNHVEAERLPVTYCLKPVTSDGSLSGGWISRVAAFAREFRLLQQGWTRQERLVCFAFPASSVYYIKSQNTWNIPCSTKVYLSQWIKLDLSSQGKQHPTIPREHTENVHDNWVIQSNSQLGSVGKTQTLRLSEVWTWVNSTP